MNAGVTLQCQNCGLYSSITDMYYCSVCNKVLCKRKSCICEEPELPYCPVCFDIYPPGDAMKNSLRCTKCFECPECLTQLIKSKGANKEGSSYWLCTACNWRSTFIGLEGQDDKQLLEFTQNLYSNTNNNDMSSSSSSHSNEEISSVTPTSGVTPITPTTPLSAQAINTDKAKLMSIVNSLNEQFPHKLDISSNLKVSSKLRYLNLNKNLSNKTNESTTPTGWNSEQLKEKLHKQEEDNKFVISDTSSEDHYNHVLEECNSQEMIKETMPSTTLLYDNNTCYITNKQSTYPICVPLRSKKHKKCLQCLKNNTTTFLLKSVANPLKGDSYNMKIKDDWYTIQSFAIVTYPILSLLQPFPVVSEDRFRIRITNPCNLHGSLVTESIQIHLVQYDTQDTNCKVHFPTDITVPGEDPATYTESKEPVEYPEFVESIGPNYVILYTYIEKEEDVPALFYLQFDCTIHEEDKIIKNSIIYKIQLPSQ